MDFEKLTSQLAQQNGKKPCKKCPKKQIGIEERIVELSKANASMVAIWTVDKDGNLQYTCHRENFPVADLQPAAEQFSRDQFEEYVRALAREAVSQ